jgi:hypothetical protein
MSLSRPETPLPRIPSYENAMALGSGASTPPEWVSGTTRVDRKLMLIYNPDPTGGASGFDDQTDGFIKGLGVWSLNMISDIVGFSYGSIVDCGGEWRDGIPDLS